MTASKIDGNAIARSIRERLAHEVKQKQETNPRYRPSLKIVQGERVYIWLPCRYDFAHANWFRSGRQV